MAKICSSVGWREEPVSGEIVYVAKKNFRQHIESKTWILLNSYN
jgi:hypothetical protein